MKKILLIDGNSIAYRAFYGSAYGPQGILTNSKGIPVNAVSVFNRMISKVILRYDPSHVFVAFDSGKKTKRHNKLKSYKGGRQSTPQELIIQFPLIKNMLDKMGIKRYELSEIEADDIIASLAKKFHKKDNVIYVFSSDKDMYQIVDSQINIIVPQNGNKDNKIIEIKNFYEKMGYYPKQVIDIKAIAGDLSDNLPGVRGIGEKGAIQLLEKFNTLEGIYDNLEKHSKSHKSKLIESKDIAFLCKDIATLDLDVPVPFNLDEIKFQERANEKLIQFFKKLGINTLVKKYENMKIIEDEKEKKSKNSQIYLDNILL